jgi:hypothetical protein
VARSSACITSLSPEAQGLTQGNFNKAAANVNCNARPANTMRQGKARRSSLTAQARPMKTEIPSALCRKRGTGLVRS